VALINPFLAPEAEPAAPVAQTPNAVTQAAQSGFVNPFVDQTPVGLGLDDWGDGVVEPPGRMASIAGGLAQGAGTMFANVPREIGLQQVQGAVDTLGYFKAVDEGGMGLKSLAARADTPGKLAYLQGDASEREALRREATKAVDAPQQTNFYKVGEAMDAWVAKNAPTNPKYEKEFWSGKVPSWVGSALGFAGQGLILHRPLVRAGFTPVKAGAASAAIGGATSQAVEGFQDSR